MNDEDELYKLVTTSRWKSFILHHTYDPPKKSIKGVDYSVEDERKFLELIEDGHENKGWNGIGYHIIIMPSGRVWYSNRWKQQINGAHCKGHNNNTIGICMFGNMMLDEPTDEQTVSLAMTIHGINLAIKKKLPISFHRHYTNTRCPGENINNEYLKLLYSHLKMLDIHSDIFNVLKETRNL
jgi:N-acetylmuramoyl-L-alanine amidase